MDTAVNALCSHVSESQFFETYDRNRLKEAPRSDFINGWRIDYVAFGNESNMDQPPIVILGGAFQNFNSYKYFIGALLDAAPVMLVDLPSMGSNPQTHNDHLNLSAKDISIPEVAQLLSTWVESVGLEQISLMGMSLGSAVAASFAKHNPERMKRLVLMGVFERTRPSWRMLIEESLNMLGEQRMQDFGEEVVLYLVNHAKLETTRMSPIARKLFHEQMSTFSHNERLRYRINAHRLLTLEEVPKPDCETLVATGQYDSFTLPHENAAFAKGCKNATFALIDNADHVPQLQKRKQTVNMLAAFVRGKSVADVEGVSTLSQTQIDAMNKRADERVSLECGATLTHKHNTLPPTQVHVHDLSFFGISFSAKSIEEASNLFAESRSMKISLKDAEGVFDLGVLQFEQKGRRIRAIFKHGTFEQAERMNRYMKSLRSGAESVEQTG